LSRVSEAGPWPARGLRLPLRRLGSVLSQDGRKTPTKRAESPPQAKCLPHMT